MQNPAGQTEGHERLKEFMEARGLKQCDLTSGVKVSEASATSWLRYGRVPRTEHQLRIERWTDGHVLPGMWVTPRARQVIESITPAVVARAA